LGGFDKGLEKSPSNPLLKKGEVKEFFPEGN
jgi:hypothetical protein